MRQILLPNAIDIGFEIYFPERVSSDRRGRKSLEKREPPKELLDLVARYAEHREAYKAEIYKEAQLRKEFIDSFLELLGWDVTNRQGYAEAYKEVIHEYAISVGRTTKAPDYCFRIGGTRKFFLEAKKPSVNLKDDPDPALQLRRYGWSANLPLCILTNFEEWAIFDTRFRPKKEDTASTARIQYLKYSDLPRRWDILYRTFSKEAVLKGSFDRYAESWKEKKGTSEVDDAFLKEIEGWRQELAKNIALRNPSLSQRDLNFAVQTTVDRLIFLRICEDRGIESYGRLRTLLQGEGVYDRLKEFYRLAEERYNSGLFYFAHERDRAGEPDTFTPSLGIDDRTLKSIIRNLYYPESPYEFSILPAEVLGQVYEQFLGRVIRLTAGHRAIVEERPEVKKAGGVYYTPAYIVGYIIRTVLDKMLDGKTPAEVGGLRILDPACGSGSFLIGAYQYLLDWHLDWYVKDGPKKHKKAVFQGPGGIWLLTVEERKRILLSNIYGVDIDPQAVEVTKLSLLLKVLEQVSGETIDKNQKLFHERALPDLDNNVKCGNSLIGPPHLQQLILQDQDLQRVNPFDWKTEFPEVFSRDGGFDAVIGNPPYIRVQMMQEWAPIEVELYKKFYRSASRGNYDIYVVFVERGLELLRRGGRLGFILPHKFFKMEYGEPLREMIAAGQNLAHVVHFDEQQVFEGATTYTCLLFLEKSPRRQSDIVFVTDLDAWKNAFSGESLQIEADLLSSQEWNFVAGAAGHLFRKFQEFPTTLGQVAEKIFQGLATSADSIFVLARRKESPKTCRVFSRALDEEVEIESELLHPLLKGAEIPRYGSPEYENLVLFPYRVIDGVADPIPERQLASSFPLAYRYLRRNREALLARSKTTAANWWLYPYPKNLGLYGRRKILSQVLSESGRFTYDHLGKFFFLGGGTAGGNAILVPNDDSRLTKILLAILNSKVTTFWVARTGSGFRGGFHAYGKSSLAKLPLPIIDTTSRLCSRIVELVDRAIQAEDKVKRSRTDQDRNLYLREMASIEEEIEKSVYELYGLTDSEIRELGTSS